MFCLFVCFLPPSHAGLVLLFRSAFVVFSFADLYNLGHYESFMFLLVTSGFHVQFLMTGYILSSQSDYS